MIMQSAAVYLQHRQVKRCSSSEHVQTFAKCLLYAINGGVDEKSGEQVGPNYAPITAEYLDYDEVMAKYDKMMDWLVDIYVNTLNLIHTCMTNTTMRQQSLHSWIQT